MIATASIQKQPVETLVIAAEAAFGEPVPGIGFVQIFPFEGAGAGTGVEFDATGSQGSLLPQNKQVALMYSLGVLHDGHTPLVMPKSVPRNTPIP